MAVPLFTYIGVNLSSGARYRGKSWPVGSVFLHFCRSTRVEMSVLRTM